MEGTDLGPLATTLILLLVLLLVLLLALLLALLLVLLVLLVLMLVLMLVLLVLLLLTLLVVVLIDLLLVLLMLVLLLVLIPWAISRRRKPGWSCGSGPSWPVRVSPSPHRLHRYPSPRNPWPLPMRGTTALRCPSCAFPRLSLAFRGGDSIA